MNGKNIILSCYNKYCVFNRNNKCVRTEVSLSRVGVCEDMFLINANKIKNLQNLKSKYINNMFEPTDKIMQNDVDWFHKQMDAKEIHPLEEIFKEAKKLIDNEKRTKN